MAARKHRRPRPSRRTEGDGGSYWIYGQHAVRSALANPERTRQRLLVVADQAAAFANTSPAPEIKERGEIEQMLPSGAVHQGTALLVEPLPPADLHKACLPLDRQRSCVVALDQVTDPRNVGAILRSAAAFGARAMILTRRHAPPESGALAKAASGGLERVPIVRVGNLVRALDELAQMGYWRYGLDAHATDDIADVDFDGHSVLLFGAEAAGLRRLTAEACDRLVRLPMASGFDSLNVSAAAAIGLYLARSGTSTTAKERHGNMNCC